MTAKKNPLVILVAARKLISDFDHWVVGEYETTHYITVGKGKAKKQIEVTCWCSDGALRKAAGLDADPPEGGYDETEELFRARQILALVEHDGNKYVPDLGEEGSKERIIAFNDDFDYTRANHKKLLQVWDKAIRVAKLIGV